jgi:hypothetical protein
MTMSGLHRLCFPPSFIQIVGSHDTLLHSCFSLNPGIALGWLPRTRSSPNVRSNPSIREVSDCTSRSRVRALTPEDFAAVFADPGQPSLFAPSLADARPILTVLPEPRSEEPGDETG